MVQVSTQGQGRVHRCGCRARATGVHGVGFSDLGLAKLRCRLKINRFAPMNPPALPIFDGYRAVVISMFLGQSMKAP
jgi:hypothetical protein